MKLTLFQKSELFLRITKHNIAIWNTSNKPSSCSLVYWHDTLPDGLTHNTQAPWMYFAQNMVSASHLNVAHFVVQDSLRMSYRANRKKHESSIHKLHELNLNKMQLQTAHHYTSVVTFRMIYNSCSLCFLSGKSHSNLPLVGCVVCLALLLTTLFVSHFLNRKTWRATSATREMYFVWEELHR